MHARRRASSREDWYESDVRAILPAVQVPTTILTMGAAITDDDRCRYVASLIPGAELREIPGDSWTSETALSYAQEVRRVAGVAPPAPDLDRVLAAVLFTDIVGSTEQLSAVGDADGVPSSRVTTSGLTWRSNVTEAATSIQPATDSSRSSDGPARAVRCAQAIGASVRDLGSDPRGRAHGRSGT